MSDRSCSKAFNEEISQGFSSNAHSNRRYSTKDTTDVLTRNRLESFSWDFFDGCRALCSISRLSAENVLFFLSLLVQYFSLFFVYLHLFFCCCCHDEIFHFIKCQSREVFWKTTIPNDNIWFETCDTYRSHFASIERVGKGKPELRMAFLLWWKQEIRSEIHKSSLKCYFFIDRRDFDLTNHWQTFHLLKDQRWCEEDDWIFPWIFSRHDDSSRNSPESSLLMRLQFDIWE